MATSSYRHCSMCFFSTPDISHMLYTKMIQTSMSTVKTVVDHTRSFMPLESISLEAVDCSLPVLMMCSDNDS